jgi:hypothetical protein
VLAPWKSWRKFSFSTPDWGCHFLQSAGGAPNAILKKCYYHHTTVAKNFLAKNLLAKAVVKATLTAVEHCREISEFRQIPASNGVFSHRNTAHWLTETPLPPPFPPHPLPSGPPNGCLRSHPQKANS